MPQRKYTFGDATLGVERMQVVARVSQLGRDVHLLGDVDTTAFIKPRKREQILDQHGHAGA